MTCLWCDDPPAEGDVFCSFCGPHARHPPVACKINPDHLPTLGPECATCADEKRTVDLIRARNQPIIDSILAIRARHVAEFNARWPGAEHGKTIVGRSLDLALEDLGARPRSPEAPRRRSGAWAR